MFSSALQGLNEPSLISDILAMSTQCSVLPKTTLCWVCGEEGSVRQSHYIMKADRSGSQAFLGHFTASYSNRGCVVSTSISSSLAQSGFHVYGYTPKTQVLVQIADVLMIYQFHSDI